MSSTSSNPKLDLDSTLVFVSSSSSETTASFPFLPFFFFLPFSLSLLISFWRKWHNIKITRFLINQLTPICMTHFAFVLHVSIYIVLKQKANDLWL
jgi:uncharacterized membrane protein (DUF485 family)